MTVPQTPSSSLAASRPPGRRRRGLTSANVAEVRSLLGSLSKRIPVWMPRNDIVLRPSMYHQSPS